MGQSQSQSIRSMAEQLWVHGVQQLRQLHRVANDVAGKGRHADTELPRGDKKRTEPAARVAPEGSGDYALDRPQEWEILLVRKC